MPSVLDPTPSPAASTQLDATVAYFREEIDTYERLFDKFLRRGRKIMKKYKDQRTPREEAVTRYNILWANVQTRLPALYARNPKVMVERRYRDADPVGRVASDILERSIQYTLDCVNDAWQVNRQTVMDYELPGRGTTWVRYVPHFKKVSIKPEGGEEFGEDENTSLTGEAAQPLTGADESKPEHSPEEEIAAAGLQSSNEADSEVEEDQLHYEETKLDYVYWEDFGHTWARTWGEVRAIWKRVYMERDELAERFGKSGENPDGLTESELNAIPLDWSPKTLNDAKVPLSRKKSVIYEIWDRKKGEVLWLVKNYPRLLDRRDDMLGLHDFWPCPRPLMANLLNDEMIPVPNYAFYQDQANEIDELSTRISSITKALKVAGVRDSSAEGLDRLLSEGVENALVPVDGWAALKEKGGLAGTFELLPMEVIANTLESLRTQREALIEDIYQLTGIADIVRGMSDPTETATAQQMKGQFSMIRMQDAQQEVQRFCRDQVVIIGQIVASYDIETLKAISGVKLLTAAEKQALQIQIAMAQAQQQAAQQPPAAAGPSPPGPPGAPPGPPPGAPPMAMPHPGPPQGAPGPGAPPGPSAAQPQAAPAGGNMHPMMPSAPQTPAPGQAPPSPEKLKLLELPTWEEVAALLENPVMREFRLDIETDSTIRMDEEAEKSARIELITAVGGFIQQAMAAGMQAPEIMPMMGELLMFGLRAFKSARAVEQTFEDMMEALNKMSKQPKGPDPKIAAIQAQGQVDMQIQSAKGQMEAQVEQTKQEAQSKQNALEQQLEQARAEKDAQLQASLEKQKMELDARTQMQIEELKQHFEAERVQWETAAKERIAKMQFEHEAAEKDKDRAHEKSMTAVKHAHEQKIAAMKPKDSDDKKAA
jgi:hypothetical protein